MKKATIILLAVILMLFALPLLFLLLRSVLLDEGEKTLFSLAQFRKAFDDPQFISSLINSARITLAALFIHIPVSLVAGLMLVKGRFPGKRFLNSLYILALLCPFQVVMMPVYQMSCMTALYDSQWGVIILASFSPLGPLVISVLIKGIPEEQWEAAHIETSSMLQIFRLVVLPQIASGVMLLGILTFADVWNMVEQPLILLSTVSKRPLSLALNDYMDMTTEYLWAGSVIYASPIVAVYAVLICVLWRKQMPPVNPTSHMNSLSK